MRHALAPVDANLPRASQFEPAKPRTRARSDGAPYISPESQFADDDLWNLSQRVGHLEAALGETERANSAIRGELTRLDGVESELLRQRTANAPLIGAYLAAVRDEERRLLREPRADFC
jgi:hypothetical protein